MKLILNIFCWILAVFCFYFPFSYYDSVMNKKEVKISHILVDSEHKAQEIRQNIIDKKITFEHAAFMYSIDSSAKDKGDIGFVMKDLLHDEFKDIAFRLNKGQVSEIIKSDDGWHIIKITDIKKFSDKDSFPNHK